MDEEANASPPSSSATAPAPPPLPPPTRGAGFWIRAVSYCVDLVWLSVLGEVAAAITFAWASSPSAVDRAQRRLEHDLGLSMLFELVVGFLLSAIMQGMCGSSPGKLLCRLEVRSVTGARIGFVAAAKRSLMVPVDIFPAFGVNAARVMRRSPLRQRCGDLWAHTVVLPVHDARLYGRTPRTAVALALVAASLVVIACQVGVRALFGAFAGG